MQRLREEQDVKAIFVGIGMPEAKREAIFEGLTVESGFYTCRSLAASPYSFKKRLRHLSGIAEILTRILI